MLPGKPPGTASRPMIAFIGPGSGCIPTTAPDQAMRGGEALSQSLPLVSRRFPPSVLISTPICIQFSLSIMQADDLGRAWSGSWIFGSELAKICPIPFFG